MRNSLHFIFSLMLLIALAPQGVQAENISEDFSSWSDNSYGGTNSYTDGNGGMWESNNALIGALNACTGSSAMRFNDDSGSNEYMMYMGLDGNGKDVGIGSITFNYNHWDADGSPVSFEVQYNQAGAGWVTVGGTVSVTSTSCMTFNESVELEGDDILIRVIAIEDDERLLIDNFTVDDYVAPVPVTLAAFSAEAEDKTVTLSWTTASEENNDYFSIEHSTDGLTYTEIDYVKGAGTSILQNNYEYFHRNPAKGANYYRLAQVDYNRSVNYSPVEVVEIAGADLFSAYPTLTKGEIILNFSEEISTAANIEVFDLMGRMVFSEPMEMQATNQNLDLSELQNGHYLVRIQTAGQAHAVRFVKY